MDKLSTANESFGRAQEKANGRRLATNQQFLLPCLPFSLSLACSSPSLPSLPPPPPHPSLGLIDRQTIEGLGKPSPGLFQASRSRLLGKVGMSQRSHQIMGLFQRCGRDGLPRSLISTLGFICISCGALPLSNSRPFAETYVMENNSAK